MCEEPVVVLQPQEEGTLSVPIGLCINTERAELGSILVRRQRVLGVFVEGGGYLRVDMRFKAKVLQDKLLVFAGM